MAIIPYLQIDKLTKSYGTRMLFADVTLGINAGDRIGIIAKNGAGKSTLLRIIAGAESADSGTVTARAGLRVTLLEQEPQIDLSAEPSAEEVRLRTQLGVQITPAQGNGLSGGQRKRLALAHTLASDPDLVILDEPTNHLDIKAIEWLEGYLGRSSNRALLMVTHDRYFLDRVCNRIVELTPEGIYVYDGNYDYYLRRRAERIEAMTAELSRVRNTLRREQEWMSRQPQARAGKAQYRIDAFYDLQARKSELSDPLSKVNDNVRLETRSSRIGKKIFEARHVNKAFGDKMILRDFSYDFARGEKVGIVGANGIGKSTFIKMLQGLESPDSGSFDVGPTVRFGYYSQEGLQLDPQSTVIDAVRAIAEAIDPGASSSSQLVTAQQWLTRFLFSVPDQQKRIASLSGGELCRLHLATVLMRRPNFLILDEPTNDLDIVTLGILEEYLAGFEGCAIIVSHDRYFLDNIVDHLFVMEGDGRVRDFPGNYSEYRALKAESQESRAQRTAEVKGRPKREPSNRLTFKERRELEALTADIDALTAEKASLEADFAAGRVTDESSRRYAELKDLLDEKEMRWLELSEKEP